MAGVDLELKQAISQLQAKRLQTNQQLMIQARQIDQLKRDARRRQLVLEELSGLGSDSRVFAAVGRMFMLQPVAEICGDIGARIVTCEEKARALEGNKTYLEQSLKEAENNLREMINAKHGK